MRNKWATQEAQRWPTHTLIQEVRMRSAPLPDAEELAKYNNIIPNGADRIMIMAEKQADHRREMEARNVSSQLKESNNWQKYAFVIVIVWMIIGWILLYVGKEIAGGIFGWAPLAIVVWSFLKSKSDQSKSLNNKKPSQVIDSE